MLVMLAGLVALPLCAWHVTACWQLAMAATSSSQSAVHTVRAVLAAVPGMSLLGPLRVPLCCMAAQISAARPFTCCSMMVCVALGERLIGWVHGIVLASLRIVQADLSVVHGLAGSIHSHRDGAAVELVAECFICQAHLVPTYDQMGGRGHVLRRCVRSTTVLVVLATSSPCWYCHTRLLLSTCLVLQLVRCHQRMLRAMRTAHGITSHLAAASCCAS